MIVLDIGKEKSQQFKGNPVEEVPRECYVGARTKQLEFVTLRKKRLVSRICLGSKSRVCRGGILLAVGIMLPERRGCSLQSSKMRLT